MTHVRSKDGTTIEYDTSGTGPAVILISGASTTRMVNAELAALLSKEFTVYNYDRRGRGGSGDTKPYAVEREVEDIAAVIEVAGGEAALYGSSSGAALALEAAASGLPVTKLVLWEPPFMLDPGAAQRQQEYVTALHEHLDAGRRGDAIALFMSYVGMPREMIEQARQMPWFSATEQIAHTLPYDATVMRDHSVPVDRAALVHQPTLVLMGEKTPWADATADALVAALPRGTKLTLPGQDHNVSAEAEAPPIAEFLAA
jgi:pimeloyl-ACP methyl ester carboxylesterase